MKDLLDIAEWPLICWTAKNNVFAIQSPPQCYESSSGRKNSEAPLSTSPVSSGKASLPPCTHLWWSDMSPALWQIVLCATLKPKCRLLYESPVAIQCKAMAIRRPGSTFLTNEGIFPVKTGGQAFNHLMEKLKGNSQKGLIRKVMENNCYRPLLFAKQVRSRQVQ